jgi:hypothetical protein
VVAERKRANNICEQPYRGGSLNIADLDSLIDNASNFTTGQAAASLTSTALAPTTKNDKALFDEVGNCLRNLEGSADSRMFLFCRKSVGHKVAAHMFCNSSPSYRHV